MGKILITGANGYIGKHVVVEMKNRGIDFLATDYNISNLPLEVSSVQCDLFRENDIYEKLGCPDVLLHLAWKDGFVHNAESHMADLSSHYKFITTMINAGVKHVCVMGSMHEIGYYEGAIEEDTPTNPLSQYAIAKNALRQSLTLYCKEKDVTFQWIRGFYIYGDDAQGNSIFAKLQQAVKEGKTSFPFTTGKNKYDFISIYELAKQISAVVLQKEVTGVINCCSGKAVSLAQEVEWYIKENKLNIDLEYGVYPDRKYDSPKIYGSTVKINQIMETEK